MILCCGEALIDMLPGEATDGRAAFVPHCGGAVFNTAIALGRLGIGTGIVTGLSRDIFGVMLEDALRDAGVATDHALRTERPTTLAFVKLENGQASYSFFDENSAGRMLRPAEMPRLESNSDVHALFLGGISLAVEPSGEAYAALLDAARPGRAVMIDPNIRPGFITDEPRYRQRLARMLAQADIVKISDEDLDWLDPGNAPLAEKAARLLAQGPSLVIVTRGADGALALHRSGAVVTKPAHRAQVVDTVGAGDSFNAGVLAQLDRARLLSSEAVAALTPAQVEAALEFGARVAAVTVSRAGANPPWAREI